MTLLRLFCALRLLAFGNAYYPSNVPQPSKHDLVLLLTADTQYHFHCEPTNIECKQASCACRQSPLCPSVKPTLKPNEVIDCVKIEGRFANRVQRLALEKLIKNLTYEPSALLINGDLTNFGHEDQFQEFESGWMTQFPVPILAGLGNHDYSNNVDDCFLNVCAQKMLSWLTEHGKQNNLNLEVAVTDKGRVSTGSFAYRTRLCSIAGSNCAYVLQLNNAIDYERHIVAFDMNYNITSPKNWLRKELKLLLSKEDAPILINLHQNENVDRSKLKGIIEECLREQKYKSKRPQVAVFFGHMHQKHETTTYCLNGVPVPFTYVGSVPNNRFSLLQLNSNRTTLQGYVAKKKGPEYLSTLQNFWPSKCSRTTSHVFAEAAK